MKYQHNRNDKQSKRDHKLNKAVDVLWIIDLVAGTIILACWMLFTTVFSPCRPGSVCIAQAFAFIAIVPALGVMILTAVGALVTFVLAKALKVDIGEGWKIIALLVAWAIMYGLLYWTP